MRADIDPRVRAERSRRGKKNEKRTSKVFWRPEELDLVKELALKYPDNVIAEKLGRSEKAVRHKRCGTFRLCGQNGRNW